LFGQHISPAVVAELLPVRNADVRISVSHHDPASTVQNPGERSLRNPSGFSGVRFSPGA
jgi:hypothetical protein